MFQYIIQPGDTLFRIADYFDVSVAAIIAANPGLNLQRIFPGQVILIPVSGNLRRNYPWYFLLPYLFIRHPRRFWDDRRRWPRDWRDRDRRGRRDWDRRDRRDRRGSMGNWNDVVALQDFDDWEDDEWGRMEGYQLDVLPDDQDFWQL